MTGADRALDQLTALRFVAAFAVMLSHLEFLGTTWSAPLRAAYDIVLRQGYAGVGFFYILSGFILTHAYRDRLIAREVSRSTYLYHRATRIFPLHWAVALPFLFWVVLIKGEAPGLSAVTLNLALLQSWWPSPDIHYSLNGPSWSLSDELFFYFCFPLLILLRPMHLKLVTLAGLAVIATAASIAAFSGRGYSARIEWVFYVFPLTRLLEFLIGIIVYDLYRAGTALRWAGTRAELAIALALATTIGLCAMTALPLALRYQLIFVPVMSAAVLIFAHGRGHISQWLRSPVMVRLGEASFALYLTHRPIITALKDAAGPAPGASVLLATALLIACPIVALIVFGGFERPVMRWLRRLPASRPAWRRPIAQRGNR